MDHRHITRRFVLGLGLAVLALSFVRPSHAHDLAIDRLTLWFERERGTLRGQIVFDPELTRRADESPSPEAERRVLAFLSEHLRIEVDGQPLKIEYTVRELWVSAGATLGDSVMLSARMPERARELRVVVPPAIKALVVSVQSAQGEATPARSTLVFGGRASPPYRFDGQPLEPSWREGSADQFSLDAGAGVPPGLQQPPARALPAAPDPGFAAKSVWAEAVRYLGLGVVHILPRGWDHVLFVAGLVLGAGQRFKPLLLQLSAFTLAHSLTLALGALGLVVLPSKLVETLIALSLAVVAVENLLQRGTPRQRVWLVLCFGLLHGQGFARVLTELELPRQSFLVALVSFNLGVEAGQLIVVAGLSVLLYWLRDPLAFRRYAVVPGSLFIAAIGAYWAVERLLGPG